MASTQEQEQEQEPKTTGVTSTKMLRAVHNDTRLLGYNQLPTTTGVTSTKTLRAVQNGTRLLVYNQLPTTMTYLKDIRWSGNVNPPGYPNFIRPNDTGDITHSGGPNFGSKAAVIYTASNQRGNSCAWVLAWDAPSDHTPTSNKVFVACGFKSRIEAMTDAEIRSDLDNALRNYDATDQDSKTSASASITYSTQIRAAIVSANFGLLY